MTFRPLNGSLFAAVLCAAPLFAQGEPTSPAPAEPLPGALRDWQSQHGSAWRVRADQETGYARLLHGGSALPQLLPANDAEFETVARQHLSDAAALTGIDPATLVRTRVQLLPFGLTGGTDKVVVKFEQRVAGVPVESSSVTVLLAKDGHLLSIDAQALPQLDATSTLPQLTAEDARAFARSRFAEVTGMAGTSATAPRLVIAQEVAGKRRVPVLAWQLEVGERSTGKTAAYRYTVAARGGARVIATEDLVHRFDVSGTVSTLATPGLLPDSPQNPPVAQPMAYATVSGPAGTTTTDENGFFNFPGVDGPIALTFEYEGLYNDVGVATGPEHVLTQTLSGTGNSVLMNPNGTEDFTAQANTFVELNRMRDWVRSVNPADATMDAVNTSNVSLDFVDFGGGFIIENCNAFFGGDSTNYFIEDGGCVNTAFSTVIAHEQGHWLNVRYNSGNGSDGFGEGNADVFAMYLYDSSVVGDGFFGAGSDIRDGTNTLQYCGDGNGGCYGAVHTDGQVHMGAMWKMRRNLKTSNGASLGSAIADQLFLGWMNAFDQGNIDSIVIAQLLTLDDDDGNIDNGTPHYSDINEGFKEQGFPGFDLTLISIDNVVAIASTFDEVGPYGVAADLAALEASGIASAEVVLDAGAGQTTVPMTLQSGSTYTALVPGFASPAEVAYYVLVTDTAGNTATWPKNGDEQPARFNVGLRRSYYFEAFDGGNDAGWTSAEIQTQNDWQRDVPAGRSGTSQGVSWSDPSAAFSGTRCWGNDLGLQGFNGSYMPDVSNVLTSPLIDLSDAQGAKLSFQRWLTVEEGVFDQAEIQLNGSSIWSNPLNGNLIDTAWTPFSVDLSQADGDPAARIEFTLESDGGLNLGGWNIDDLEIFSLEASPSDCPPLNYGTGLAGTDGVVPALDTAGQQPQLGNADFRLAVKNGLPSASALVGLGTASTNLPLLGGDLLVIPSVITTVGLDLFGQATLPIPLGTNPGLVGATLYVQAFISDPNAPEGFAISPGLEFTVCN